MEKITTLLTEQGSKGNREDQATESALQILSAGWGTRQMENQAAELMRGAIMKGSGEGATAKANLIDKATRRRPETGKENPEARGELADQASSLGERAVRLWMESERGEEEVALLIAERLQKMQAKWERADFVEATENRRRRDKGESEPKKALESGQDRRDQETADLAEVAQALTCFGLAGREATNRAGSRLGEDQLEILRARLSWWLKILATMAEE
jgi:hypothetical protein